MVSLALSYQLLSEATRCDDRLVSQCLGRTLSGWRIKPKTNDAIDHRQRPTGLMAGIEQLQPSLV